MVWSANDGEGLEHDETTMPAVPGPEESAGIQELLPDDAAAAVPVLGEPRREAARVRGRLAAGRTPPGALAGVAALHARPPTFDDPWVDATRSVILVDLPSWPSAHRPHAWKQPPFIAPTLDLNVAFHRPTSGEEWLLCDGAAPLSTGGLFGWTARRLVPEWPAPRVRRRPVPLPPDAPPPALTPWAARSASGSRRRARR